MAYQTTASVTTSASTILTGRHDCTGWTIEVQQGEAGTVYCTKDGSTPTASNGFTLVAGQSASNRKPFPDPECKATIKAVASAGTIKVNVDATHTMD